MSEQIWNGMMFKLVIQGTNPPPIDTNELGTLQIPKADLKSALIKLDYRDQYGFNCAKQVWEIIDWGIYLAAALLKVLTYLFVTWLLVDGRLLYYFIHVGGQRNRITEMGVVQFSRFYRRWKKLKGTKSFDTIVGEGDSSE